MRRTDTSASDNAAVTLSCARDPACASLQATSRHINSLYKIVTTHKTYSAALLAVVVGLGLLWATTYFDWFNHHSITKGLLREVGPLLFVAVAVTLIWELAGKRAFLDEVLSSVRISENLRQAGIKETFFDFATIRWNELFAGVTDFEAFISYGYYRFGNRILFVLYRNGGQRGALPALLISRGGLYNFFSQRYGRVGYCHLTSGPA